MEFEGKVVAITGASGGIGRELCHYFGKEGAKIVALDISPAVTQFADELRKDGIATESAVFDIGDNEAVKAVFGDQARKLVFGSTKSMTGHLLGGAGALEFAVSLLASRCGVIPPTINQFTPDPGCDLNSAPNRKVERRVDVALSNSFGFGGHNVTLAVRRWES